MKLYKRQGFYIAQPNVQDTFATEAIFAITNGTTLTWN